MKQSSSRKQSNETDWVEEELPLKQGLKLQSGNFIRKCFHVEEELPLKQGLKLALPKGTSCSPKIVEEELPLKQGLKLKQSILTVIGATGWRGTSIKTRIET